MCKVSIVNGEGALFFFQKWKYLFSFYNVIVWSLMATTVGFIATIEEDCVVHWRFGWIAMFLAWINFIMYLRR